MELTLKEAKPLLKYIITNNQTLQAKGEVPIAVSLCGLAGLGKSLMIKQLADELGFNYVKLSLAMISEMGDLAGYPIQEHYVCKDDDCQWITSKLIKSYAEAGYDITSETRMSYALPEWYKSIDPSKGTILLLDDFSRALPAVMQSVMELVYQQEFWSFKLPANTHIILTENPDSGDFQVNGMDEAQKSRYITFNVKFDISSWMSWAEEQGMDGRAINFLGLYYTELMDRKNTHEQKINARTYTMFANIISGIEDWEDANNLGTIMKISSGCFNDSDDIVGSLFARFIANKLDRLISPEDMLMQSWDTVKAKMENCVYTNGAYRPEIASILTTRLLNYSLLYLSQKGAKFDVVEQRILDIVDYDKTLFTEDLLFVLVKNLVNKYTAKMRKLMLNPKIRNKVI